MSEVLWLLTGCALVFALTSMQILIWTTGELRGGLEIWAELMMRILTFGRWRTEEVTDE